MTEDEEEWRPVVGYEGLYEVSSLGRVRSLDRVVEVKPSKRQKHGYRSKYQGKLIAHVAGGKDGKYPSVALSRRGLKKKRLIHVLVCEAFHGPRPDGHEAAHNDGNSGNPIVSNVRWATHEDNMNDRWLHGTMLAAERHPSAKLTTEEVGKIKAIAGLTQAQIAKQFGISRSHVASIRRGVWRKTG